MSGGPPSSVDSLYDPKLDQKASQPFSRRRSRLDRSGSLYRAGALVFGGGPVVLRLLRDALVPSGWLSDDTFLTGYSFAQGMPGPLFTFAAYLGAVSAPAHASVLWATVALIVIFLPGLRLAIVGMSLWSRLAQASVAPAILAGVNAAVVGVLGAALCNPVWITGIRGSVDVAAAVTGFVLLERWNARPILVVALCVAVSIATAAVTQRNNKDGCHRVTHMVGYRE